MRRRRGERVPERARYDEASGAGEVRDCGSGTDRVADQALQALVVRRRPNRAMIDGDRDRDARRGHARTALRDVQGARRIVEDHDRNAIGGVQNDPALRREFVE